MALRTVGRGAAIWLLACLVLGRPSLGDEFASARRVLEQAISSQAFPGCAFAVGTSEKVLWQGGVGHFTYEESDAASVGLRGNPVPSEQTIYDLASLTKVVGTTSVVLALVAEDRLSLDDPVIRWVPEFGGNDELRKAVTVEHLLVHASGLPAWRAFYKEVDGYEKLLANVASTPLETEPGSKYRYSDLGFMLLGEIAQRAGGRPLPELEQSLVFERLEMDNTTRKISMEQRQNVPPTERDPESKQFVHGEVHDENGRAGSGGTGHAGLFSSAADLSRFASEYLLALKGRSQVLPQQEAQLFTKRRELIEGSSRALGWDTPSGRSSGGSLISPTAFGHTGFTGTSIWIDPVRDVYLILLTNRVHPTRDNRQISRVRREFADAVLSAIDAR